MTHQEENPVVDHVMAVLIEHGPAAIALAFATFMNLPMQIERQQALEAEAHQRIEERQGYANGFKSKTMRTRVGEVSLRIPQTRKYHDEEGRPFYPKSLERGVRSERAMTLPVAEMEAKGVSTRKITAVIEKLCGLEENVPEALADLNCPPPHRRKFMTTNGLERLSKAIKRRTRVATLFPIEASLLRLVPAVLSEISDEWKTQRNCLTMETR